MEDIFLPLKAYIIPPSSELDCHLECLVNTLNPKPWEDALMLLLILAQLHSLPGSGMAP